MPEQRQDPIRGHIALIAPGRGEKATDFPPVAAGLWDGRSNPFRPGAEAGTPREVGSVRLNDSPPDSPGWSVRAFPNKYPFLVDRTDARIFDSSESLRARPAWGAHEVVVITPEPTQGLAQLNVDGLDRVLALIQHRIVELSERPGIKYISVFENRGVEAGASRRHAHFQILATEFVPPAVEQMRKRIRTQTLNRGQSPYDFVLNAELDAGVRLVSADSAFVTLTPFASRTPYEMMLLPRAHRASFADVPQGERRRLAIHLRDVMGRLRRCLDDPPYNLVLNTLLPRESSSKELCWHFEILPRTKVFGGLEWAGGFFVNEVTPEFAAERLRGSGDV